MATELKLSRRSVLFGAGAVALIAVLPAVAKAERVAVVLDDPNIEWHIYEPWNGTIGEYRVVRVAKHIGRAEIYIGDPVVGFLSK